MKVYNYIGGKLQTALSESSLENINPSTGQRLGFLPDSSAEDVKLAIESAELAYESWSKTSPEIRSKWLRKLALEIENRMEELTIQGCLDTGKPLYFVQKMDIERSVENLRFYSGALLHEQHEAFHSTNGPLTFTLRQPIGVVACINPWNLPLYHLTLKIAPALAAGNTVVVKPSEYTPILAYFFSKILEELEFPKGVINIVHGLGEIVGATLVTSSQVKALAFTGGSSTGKKIASVAARQLKRLSLEMGNKNPAIVFKGSNLDKAVEGIINAAFIYQGEVSLAGSRILVEKSVYDEFKSKLLNNIHEIKIGDPLDTNNQMGAIITEGLRDEVLNDIERSLQEGGKLLTGGKTLQINNCENGFFIAPTLIEGLSMNTRTNQEEIYGPVSTLAPFDNEEQALSLANQSQFGLSASVWTKDLGKAHRMAQRLSVGMVNVNSWLNRDLRTPFSGTKNSGMGREGGLHAIRFFTDEKTITINYD